MKIFISKYLLSGNAKTRSRAGALLKLVDGESFGVADISPIPHLGDAELTTEGPLFKRAVFLAQQDLAARKSGFSLLQNKPVKNNYLVTDYRSEDLNQPAFRNQSVKIKADAGILLQKISIPYHIRLDFNSALLPSEFSDFLQSLSPQLRSRIEYIEDPTLFCSEWEQWNKIVPLAFDFQNADYISSHAEFQIIKPSRQALPENLQKCILTSAMDHPVGIAHGLRLAQSFATVDSGFLTLDLYDENGFQKYFSQKDNFLNFSDLALADSGIGMTATLNELEWVPLD